MSLENNNSSPTIFFDAVEEHPNINLENNNNSPTFFFDAVEERPIINLERQNSANIKEQRANDCFAYSIARFLRKLITVILVNEFPYIFDYINEENFIEKFFANIHDYIVSVYGCDGARTKNVMLLLIDELQDTEKFNWINPKEKDFYNNIFSECVFGKKCLKKTLFNNIVINKNYQKIYYLLPLKIREKITEERYIKFIKRYNISLHIIERNILKELDITLIPPSILLNSLDDGYYSIFNIPSHSMILTEYKKFDNTYNFVVKNSWGDDWEDELIRFDNDIDNKYYNKNLLDDINPDNSNIDDINRIFTFGEFITKIVSDYSKDAENVIDRKYYNSKYYIIDYYVDINKTIYDIIDKIIFNKENDENKNLEIIEGINNDIRTKYEKKKKKEKKEKNKETLKKKLKLNKL